MKIRKRIEEAMRLDPTYCRASDEEFEKASLRAAIDEIIDILEEIYDK